MCENLMETMAKRLLIKIVLSATMLMFLGTPAALPAQAGVKTGAKAGKPAAKKEQPRTGPRTFLWRIKSATTVVYLLGSLHAAPPNIFPLAPEIEKAFKDSQVLVVEADIGANRAELGQIARKYGMYPEGRGLKAALPPQTYEALLQHLGAVGLSAAQVEGMRPWMVATTLSLVHLTVAGFSQANGIDNYFLNRARGRKPIEQLESAEFQMRLFGTLPPAVETAFLENTMKDLANLKQTLSGMLDAWKRGDTAALEKLVLPKHDSPLMKVIDERVYYARNRDMTKKIRKYLKGKRVVFVVVGAGHLVGEGGIPVLLRKAVKTEGARYEIKQY